MLNFKNNVKAITNSLGVAKGPLVFFFIASFLLMFLHDAQYGRYINQDDLMNASMDSIIVSYARGFLFLVALVFALRKVSVSLRRPISYIQIGGAGFKAFACGMMGSLSVLFVFSNFVSIEAIMEASENGVEASTLFFLMLCAILMIMLLYGGSSVALSQYIANAHLNNYYTGHKKEMKQHERYVNGFKVFPLMYLRVFKSGKTYLFMLLYSLAMYGSIHSGYNLYVFLESALVSLALTFLMVMFVVQTYTELEVVATESLDGKKVIW